VSFPVDKGSDLSKPLLASHYVISYIVDKPHLARTFVAVKLLFKLLEVDINGCSLLWLPRSLLAEPSLLHFYLTFIFSFIVFFIIIVIVAIILVVAIVAGIIRALVRVTMKEVLKVVFTYVLERLSCLLNSLLPSLLELLFPFCGCFAGSLPPGSLACLSSFLGLFLALIFLGFFLEKISALSISSGVVTCLVS
jgi:hypothetical protein